MSASMTITGAPLAARCRTNNDDSVVLPLPPLPTNAIFTVASLIWTVTVVPSRNVVTSIGCPGQKHHQCATFADSPRVMLSAALSIRDNTRHPNWRQTMSMASLAQPEQQQQLQWLDGGTLAILLHGEATDGQLTVGRFDVSEGEAPPLHMH